MDSKTAMGSEPHGSPVRPDFERITLLLQGGGALGSYQAGVYQALAEANLHPEWVAGISIGGHQRRSHRGQPSRNPCGEIARVLGSRQHAAPGSAASQID